MRFSFGLYFYMLIATFSSLALASENFCQARNIPTGMGESRMATIDFPDGRQVSVIGQVHGSRDLQDFIVSGKDVDEFVVRAEVVLKSASTQRALRYLREDVALLRSALNGRVEFIGLEIDHEYVPEYKTASRMLYEAFKENTIAKQSPVSALTPLTLLFVGGPANYLNVLEPQLTAKVAMVGIENAELGDKDTDAINKTSDALKALHDAGAGDQSFLDFLDRKDHQLAFEVYPSFDPTDPMDEEAVLQQVQEFPEKYRAQAKIFLRSYVEHFKTLSARDDFSAKQILNLRKSGVVLMGLMHQQPITNRLVLACRSLF